MKFPSRTFVARLLVSTAAFFCLLNLRCTVNAVDVSPYPEVRILSPTAATQILDTVTIQIQASDDKGVTRVEVYIDGKIPAGGTIPYFPYQYYWDTSSLPDSSVHQIYAKAYDTDSNSTTSAVLTLTIHKFQPTNLAAILFGDTLVSLSWQDNCSKETGYEVIEQGTDSAYSLAALLPPNTTSAMIPGIYYSSQTYTFYVRAVIDSLKSKFSNPATVSPLVTAPSEVAASIVADTLVQLSWVIRLHSIAQFIEIDEAQNSGSFSVIKSIPSTQDSISLGGNYLVGTSYRFRLRGYTTHNNYSVFSNVVSSQVVFPAPDGLKSTAISLSVLQLQWNDNSSFEQGFSIERKTASTDFAEIARVGPNVTSYTFSNAGMDTTATYTFRVRAFTDITASAYSGSVSFNYQAGRCRGTIDSGGRSQHRSCRVRREQQ